MNPVIERDHSLEVFAEKLQKYLENEYGSIYAFKLVKYFLEHKLARENNGITIYEAAYNIAPSEILRKKDLLRISVLANGAKQENVEEAIDQLIKRGIFYYDSETQALELKVSINSLANKYLKENDSDFQVVEKELSDVIILPTVITNVARNEDGKSIISGVPDILYKGTLTSIKFL